MKKLWHSIVGHNFQPAKVVHEWGFAKDVAAYCSCGATGVYKYRNKMNDYVLCSVDECEHEYVDNAGGDKYTEQCVRCGHEKSTSWN